MSLSEASPGVFRLSLSHSRCFTGVQGRFLAPLEMTIRGYSGFVVFTSGAFPGQLSSPLEEGARRRRRIDCPAGAAFYVAE